MQLRWPIATVAITGGFIFGGISAGEQTVEKFKARLSTVAMDASMRSTVAGTRSASATLSDNHLTITGTFDGLRSRAIGAKNFTGGGSPACAVRPSLT